MWNVKALHTYMYIFNYESRSKCINKCSVYMLNNLSDFLYLIVRRPVLNIDLPLKSNISFITFFMNLSLILFSLTPRSKQGHINELVYC